MKIKYLLPAIALLAPIAASAVPVSPELVNMTNPDGSQVKIRFFGNEYFHYATDSEGIFVMERDEKGNWKKAVRNGAQLMNVAADLDRLREEKVVEDFNINVLEKGFGYDSDMRTFFPSVGENVHSLVVLLEYPDMPFTMENPVEFYTRYLNEENFQYEDLSKSARDYFVSNSRGKFKPTFDVKYYKLPNPHTYYKTANWDEALEAAVTSLSKEVDYSKYDFDNDGIVDTVYFIYSGYGLADTLWYFPENQEEFIWPHQGRMRKLNMEFNGKKFDNYACSNSLRGSSHYTNKDNAIAGMGTFCHEFSHVLGLADYYNTYGSGTSNSMQADYTPGPWSIMDGGPYNNDGRTPPNYGAIDLRLLNWLDEYKMIEEPGEYTLKPFSEEPTGARISLTSPGNTILKNEYYIIENRDKKGFDEYLPGEGIIIWHWDYKADIWTNNTPNNDKSRPRMTLLRPDGTEPIKSSIWPFKKSGSDLCYDYIGLGYENTFFCANNTRFQTEAYVTNMKINDDKSASFIFHNEAPYTTKVQNLTKEKLGLTEFKLSWEPVEDADQYMITVKRQGANRQYVVSNLEGTRISETSVNISLSTGMLEQIVTVDIRPMKDGIPSTVNFKDSFIPNKINDKDSIEGITTDDGSIYGAEGYIVAPVGSEIYNINGMRVRNENLEAGVYIVRFGNIATKVVVK